MRSAIVALSVLTAAGCAVQESGLPEPQILTPEGESHATSRFSPDGNRIAYVARGDQGWDLWVADADLAETRLLTNLGLPGGQIPVWSPDGSSIAFGGTISTLLDIGIVPAAGGEVRQLTDWSGLEVPAAWHPTRNRLLFLRTEADGSVSSGIISVNDGGAEPILTENAQGILGFAWSPDGSMIAGQSIGGGKNMIWVADGDGRNPRQLTSEGFENLAQQPWSPDGSELLYVSNRTGTGDVWVVPVDGGEPRQLTVDVRNDYGAAWSPDGEWVAFMSERGAQTDVWVVSAGGGTPHRVTDSQEQEQFLHWRPGSETLHYHAQQAAQGIWLISVTDRSELRLTPDTLEVSDPEISRDGSTVSFRIQRGGGIGDLALVSREGGAVRTVVSGAGNNYSARWSPDDSKLVFVSDRAGSDDIWVVDVAGGEPRRITDWPTDETAPEWSWDGQFIYFMSERDAGQAADVWKVPAAGGDPIRVTESRAIIEMEPSPWSDDLLVLHFGGDAGQIVLSKVLADGSLRTLWDQTSAIDLGTWNFSPDGSTVAVPVELEGGTSGTMIISLSDGSSRRVLGDREFPSAWSPDGSRLLYVRLTGPQQELGILNLEDGSTVQLTDSPEDEGGSVWTPDGESVVATRTSSRLRIVRVDLSGLLANDP